MSKFYTALVSNEGLDAIRSDFKIIIKADSIAQARAGAAARIITVERATDSEIFEAGRNGNVVLNLSDVTTDEDQHALPFDDSPQAQQVSDVGPVLSGPKSGSAPAWLPQASTPATDTGD